MRARSVARAVGVVAVVAAVVLASTFAAGMLLASPTDASASPDAPAYDADDLETDAVEESGRVSAPDDGESKTVVFDVSHGNAVSEDRVQPLVDAFVAAGHDVQFYAGSESSLGAPTQGSPFNETLRDADALVVASPATGYSNEEIDGVAAFADAGGRVLLAADPPATTTTTESVSIPGLTGETTVSAAGQPASLAARFDVTFGSGYLYDVDGAANHFQRVSASGDGGVADGVEDALLLEATPIETGPDANPVLSASDVSLSSTRESGTYAVAARNGNVLAVGDTDVFTDGVATDADNAALASNVATFLVTGDKEPDEPSGGEAGNGGQQPPGPGINGTSDTATLRSGAA